MVKSESRWWVGVDVGKEFHWMAVCDDAGKVISSRKVANDEVSIAAAITEVESRDGTVSWTVDLTTTYATLLLTMLAAAGHSVRYLTGRAVWQASAIYRGGEAKSDAKDARVIADQGRMRGDDLPLLRPNDDLVTELSMLTAHREDLVADRTRTINRLRQQLVAISPALERAAQPSTDRGWIALLARYQRPQAIRRSGITRITRVLADAGVRNAGPIAEAAVTAAKAQSITLPGEAIAADLVAELAQGVIDLDKRIKAADAAIEERFRRHPLAEAIVSLPGMGFRLGAEFLAAVGDTSRILSADHLASWAGLAPVTKDSGKRTGRLCTPQRYHRGLRRVMYLSAVSAARWDPAAKDYYQRKRAQGKKHVPATICLARRRVNVLYALIRDNRTWQPAAPQITAAAA
ncbi:Transposase IS111A/IS1328/IS1533 OS=Tsukamurella paurometabola (strain ATCC 8368 / DSM 20162 / CCUG 35730 / CIP 100753 / JCM 10117 / KCTC 9821 / NBRC 16120 /NCIMB 702349 / NCTC 13040) OX=521096 GN=Tpau_0896 PE=4 SV=1 [Tsukamurella paurometabola]|uniref:Transposase IS111A/IS1328/IS1533 n=1 Tax=Tsukamurella paurometabola (strain ATCC 8368 / DSM 20162 / CCUG 35730 / CIP 100753 / JCM 10117 / KCTC 9821 / NBRC 16120 / NCIMB 702349 / NCTC 13040) TaxID=521096 RepID=D5UMJ9_TSUPD|nr:IS110 family transposase [Tsukamurella paurometabola]ADG77530.1 transposase IS111A/IS1328/IS1533 [Tsukamurella paurometabola DSM 20162]ADG79484.1 transposase IS111A/IS1328/IS1533 [Tsukamurella paurometabola DSM 20162]ADG79838.1 transposase IS111A/IS1328/IS1533 [Tsukamurella paurometabola DSM 20162]ADG80473.1 transposase IS111A/IS1328/IS1533 [Tsukamurella paurometabola DSM 20162]SUP27591.1 Transposase IS116/IS110/IS902 family [Tsukamurella paurometabola]